MGKQRKEGSKPGPDTGGIRTRDFGSGGSSLGSYTLFIWAI